MSTRNAIRVAAGLAVTCGSLLLASQALPQGTLRPAPAPRPAPTLQPVAETRLLMEGLNQPNFKGLEKILKEKPTDDEAWVFARGQALLVAETGNLLLLRPPKNAGEDVWMQHASALRESASKLARSIAKHDHEASKSGLTDVANACNSCHKAFRSSVRVTPFAEPGERPAPLDKP
jgi:hypothetical protein